MTTSPDPHEFAAEWIDAWNTHDLERIIGHYAPDVVFTSPVAATLVPDSGGEIRGIDALRAYWAEGLRRLPDLHFELDQVLTTAGGCTLLYRNERGQQVAETMLFGSDGRVCRGVGAYGSR
jgi:hypothetical protein